MATGAAQNQVEMDESLILCHQLKGKFSSGTKF